MKIWLRNTLHGLIPLYPSDYEEKRKLKIGQDYECEIRLPRNYQYHKKVFALFNLAYQNYNLEMPFDSFRKWLTIKAGYFTIYETPNGRYYEADSLSFRNKNQAQIEEVYSRILDIIIKDIGCNSEEIEKQLIDFM